MKKDYLKPKEKSKRNFFAIGFLIFMVSGMLSGFVFFGFSPSGEKVRYNGHTFTLKGDHWEVKVNKQYVPVSFPPEEVGTISLSSEITALLRGKVQIDTTSASSDKMNATIALAQYQMGLSLEKARTFVRFGYEDNLSQFPSITCESATPFVPVIRFQSANETSISLDGSCVTIKGANEREIILAKDRVLYALLGLM